MVARLTFFYKVVEGLVPAISSNAFLMSQRPKLQIHAKHSKTLASHLTAEMLNNFEIDV